MKEKTLFTKTRKQKIPFDLEIGVLESPTFNYFK